MKIYYLLIEAKPDIDNAKRENAIGAFINCWTQAQDEKDAVNKARSYVNSEGWEIIRIEDIFIAKRELYDEKPESLECFDLACTNGIGAVFYVW